MKNANMQIKFGSEVLNFRIHPEIRRRFKAVCSAEGTSMSDKIRRWILIYTHEHERGNPQLLLSPRKEKSLLELVLDEKVPLNFFHSRIRREKTIRLAKFVNANPKMRRIDQIKLFALVEGQTVKKVREWMALLDSQARQREARK